MQGGFCLHPLIPYYQTFFDNDAAGYFDILSFHTYRPVANYPVMVRDIRDMLARNGAAGKPLWFTESGTDSEGNGEEASPVPGLRAHSPQQELMVAEFIPKSALTLQAAGVDRNFFFVLPPVNERGGAKVWGLLRRDYTVEPGFLAMAALNRVLGARSASVRSIRLRRSAASCTAGRTGKRHWLSGRCLPATAKRRPRLRPEPYRFRSVPAAAR